MKKEALPYAVLGANYDQNSDQIMSKKMHHTVMKKDIQSHKAVSNSE